jgi:DNA-binding FrmR family transcriptional regulator
MNYNANYNARMNINEEERAKLIFDEMENMEKSLFKKARKIKKYSTIFQIVNTILNLTIIVSSAVSLILTAIYNSNNVQAIVVNALIFTICSVNELLKLGPRGYYYRQGNMRLRRILGQIRDILYMYHTFTAEQILAFLSSFRAEIDEIDMDLYKNSMTGEVKFANDIRINIDSQQNTPQHSPKKNSDSHIHIHIDSSSNTPNHSPILSRTISAPLEYRKNTTTTQVLKRVDSAPVISVA